MPSAARLLEDTACAEYAVRWALVGKLGRIRSRKRGEGGELEFYLDFRPYGRVWSHRGIRLTDEETARRLMEQIRGQVADGMPLAEVLARYQPPGAKANMVPMWLGRWLEIRRRECEARSLSPGYLKELERLCRARRSLLVLRQHEHPRDLLWRARGLEPVAGRPGPRPEDSPQRDGILPRLPRLAPATGRAPRDPQVSPPEGRRARAAAAGHQRSGSRAGCDSRGGSRDLPRTGAPGSAARRGASARPRTTTTTAGCTWTRQ